MQFLTYNSLEQQFQKMYKVQHVQMLQIKAYIIQLLCNIPLESEIQTEIQTADVVCIQHKLQTSFIYNT